MSVMVFEAVARASRVVVLRERELTIIDDALPECAWYDDDAGAERLREELGCINRELVRLGERGAF